MVSIRLAAPPDLPQIACLTGRDVAWINAIRPQLAREQLLVFLASQAAEPIGYMIFQPRRIPPTPVNGWRRWLIPIRRHRAEANPTFLLHPMRMAMVQEIFVRPESRRRGVATALMTRSIEYAQTNGIDDMRVNLATVDIGLEPLYQRLGFLPLQAYLTKSLAFDAFAPLARVTEPCRPATIGDAELLTFLLRDAIHYQQTMTSAFRLRTEINWQAHCTAKLAHPDIHFRLVELDHDIVAFIELRVFHSPTQPGRWPWVRWWRGRPKPDVPPAYGVVQDIYVSPQLRRRGLASILLQDAHCWFNAQHVTHVRAAIWHENHGSFKLFQEAGYEIDAKVLNRRL